MGGVEGERHTQRKWIFREAWSLLPTWNWKPGLPSRQGELSMLVILLSAT